MSGPRLSYVDFRSALFGAEIFQDNPGFLPSDGTGTPEFCLKDNGGMDSTALMDLGFYLDKRLSDMPEFAKIRSTEVMMRTNGDTTLGGLYRALCEAAEITPEEI